jgi:hypothetical protein
MFLCPFLQESLCYPCEEERLCDDPDHHPHDLCPPIDYGLFQEAENAIRFCDGHLCNTIGPFLSISDSVDPQFVRIPGRTKMGDITVTPHFGDPENPPLKTVVMRKFLETK